MPGTAPPVLVPQRPPDHFSSNWETSGEIHTFHVQGNVYLLVGAGGNIAVQTGDEGVLVVDSGLAQHADKVLAAIRKLSDKPIRYIINTQFGPDHVGGNDVIGKAGRTTEGGATTIIANENVLNRMSASLAGKPSPYPTSAWPTSAFFTEEKDIFFNGEPVMMYHIKAGHSDSDTIVFFRGSNVVFAGDDFTKTGYPVIDLEQAAACRGTRRSEPPARYRGSGAPAEGGTYVCPAMGGLRQAGVLSTRHGDDRARSHQGHGRGRPTLQQVQAAMPTSTTTMGERGAVDDRDVRRNDLPGSVAGRPHGGATVSHISPNPGRRLLLVLAGLALVGPYRRARVGRHHGPLLRGPLRADRPAGWGRS